jgi:hypothetical protein
MRSWWKYTVWPWFGRQREKLLMGIAWRLPRSLVMWCAIRVGAHATQGQYSGQVVPDLTFMDAVRRW